LQMSQRKIEYIAVAFILSASACVGVRYAFFPDTSSGRNLKQVNPAKTCTLMQRVQTGKASEGGCQEAYTLLMKEWGGYASQGWMSVDELCTLYWLAKESGGNIAEQGPYHGLSTIMLARGMKGSKAWQHAKRLFLTTDLFAMGAKAREECEACKHYPHFWKYNTVDGSQKAMLHINGDPVPAYNLGEGLYQSAVGQFSDLPGGQMARLVSNLHRAGVHDLVSVNTGQHIPYAIPWEVVFTDATHDLHEIKYNFPKMVAEVAAQLKSRTCVTFAFHDIIAHNYTAHSPNLALKDAIDLEFKKLGLEIVDKMGSHLLDGKGKVRGSVHDNTDSMYVATVRKTSS